MADQKDDWLSALYDINLVNDDELKLMEELYQYQGFNQKEILSEMKLKIPDPKMAAEVIIICAMRGPKRAASTKTRNGRTLEQMGIPASGMKGSKGISCQRIVAATADLAAFYLKRMNVPKRIQIQCPGWLQFPSAGSIKMSDELRSQHIEFSQKFSSIIGGKFNESIYQSMINNSYLNTKLRLFDIDVISVSKQKTKV